jgi:hypothetical protein
LFGVSAGAERVKADTIASRLAFQTANSAKSPRLCQWCRLQSPQLVPPCCDWQVAIAPWKCNADGSLDIYFQNESPGKDKESNWLPAPTGAFNLTMRLYAPKTEALTGKWNPPVVTKLQVLPSLTAQ